MLTSRYTNPIAKKSGRLETNNVFEKMNAEWNE